VISFGRAEQLGGLRRGAVRDIANRSKLLAGMPSKTFGDSPSFRTPDTELTPKSSSKRGPGRL
jgi:hypothetical protein